MIESSVGKVSREVEVSLVSLDIPHVGFGLVGGGGNDSVIQSIVQGGRR